MHRLQIAILRHEPRTDLLHDCLGFGRFAEVTVTSDGWFLARARDDVGFNHFLGRPSAAAVERTRALFARLAPRVQRQVLAALAARRIPADALGLGAAGHARPEGV